MSYLDKAGLERLWLHIITKLGNILSEAKTYTEAEIASLVNSAPETLDTLGELAAAFKENEDIVVTLDSAITKKADAKNVVTTIESPLMLSDNTEYHLTGVSSLTLVYPDSNFEVWMNISFAQTGVIVVTFPAGTRYLGATPTFNNGQTWEISIKDGVVVCWRVE